MQEQADYLEDDADVKLELNISPEILFMIGIFISVFIALNYGLYFYQNGGKDEMKEEAIIETKISFSSDDENV